MNVALAVMVGMFIPSFIAGVLVGPDLSPFWRIAPWLVPALAILGILAVGH